MDDLKKTSDPKNYYEDDYFEKKRHDRRKGRDKISSLISYGTMIGWVLWLIGMMLVDRASPPLETFFDRFFGVRVRVYWEASLLLWYFVIMTILSIFSLSSLTFNLIHHRRTKDKYKISIILLAIASLGSIIFYVIFWLLT